jgi:hypothetical protein
MIFRKTFEKVLSGEKTQTRRPIKKGDLLRRSSTGPFAYIYNEISQRTRMMTQRDYAVQPGQGQASLGRIRILSIRHERLDKITPQDVRAEGFEHLYEFKDVWQELYGGGINDWSERPMVYVIDFEVVANYR